MYKRQVKQSLVDLTLVASVAYARGSIGPVACVTCLIHGATSIRNTTWELTGFPGSPKIGVLFHNPNSGGEPGLSFTLQKCNSPSSSIIFRTRSQSPIDTPPLVIIISDFEAASFRVFRKSSRVSPTQCNRIGSCPSHFTRPDNPKEFDS